MTAELRVDVQMECPNCRRRWIEAVIVVGAWWAAGVTPDRCAGRVYCRECGQGPPMTVAALLVDGQPLLPGVWP